MSEFVIDLDEAMREVEMLAAEVPMADQHELDVEFLTDQWATADEFMRRQKIERAAFLLTHHPLRTWTRTKWVEEDEIVPTLRLQTAYRSAPHEYVMDRAILQKLAEDEVVIIEWYEHQDEDVPCLGFWDMTDRFAPDWA